MSSIQKIATVCIVLSSFQQVLPIEVGKDDGGEYCYRIPGSNDGGMIPVGYDLYKSGCELSDDDNVVDPVCETMNFAEIKKMFPIFNAQVHDKPFIFFDSGATAQMPQMVIDAIVDYYQHYKSNVGRGLYVFAELATKKFEDARARIARFIGAKKQEVVFTSGATAGINLVAHIWVKHHVKKGDEIVISEVEHNANFIPWQQLADRTGVVLKRVPLNDRGVVDVATLQQYLSSKTKLVAITHQSNILGTVNDIAAISQAAHAVGAKVLVDAAQSVVHQKIDVLQLQCDFLTFSGHKLFGPTGVGVLFIKADLFDQCVLQNFGGGMVYEVRPEQTEFKSMPHCLEPGTQAIAQVIGLGAAVEFVQKHINFDQSREHETALVRMLATELQKIPGVALLSPIPQQGEHNSLVTFTVEQCHAYDVAEYLDTCGIAVRAGYHCAQPYHDKMGGKASVRVSLSVYNTQKEIEYFIECLKKLLK